MTGAEMEARVEELCNIVGVRFRFHVPRSFGMTRGLPDDIIIGRRGLLWRENKGDGDTLSSAQKQVGYALKALRQDWAVWTPADLAPGGQAELELREIG